MSKSDKNTQQRQSTEVTADNVEGVAAWLESDALAAQGPRSSSVADSNEEDASTGPPPYAEGDGYVSLTQDGFVSQAHATGDGRIDIRIDTANRRLSKIIHETFNTEVTAEEDAPPPFSPFSGGGPDGPMPSLNIVIQIVGSRGDVQPFVALGIALQNSGHRVRIATHETFQKFVQDRGLEFFNIGGDPVELMVYMVRNPGLIPSFNSLAKGEVQAKRKHIRDIMEGCWRSCFETGNGITLSNNGSKTTHGRGSTRPFVADAIIANPPSFAHIHCAEKLGIPLHLMFTMPWSPTRDFSHPLANISSSNVDPALTNYLSFVLVEMLTWQGLGNVINSFRRKVLGLGTIHATRAPGMISRLKIPHTYCWSPSLIPKPKDWQPHITISGYCLLSAPSTYKPPSDLLDFLNNGSVPIYIGFGSIVVPDPAGLTALILKAVELAEVRAIISQGWGDLGATATTHPPSIFTLGNCPHDWLFNHVSCVIHHGGSGTTAAGIVAGKPSVVVPFFGDQPFWGEMIERAGAGPASIPFKELTAEKLATAIAEALKPHVSKQVETLASKVKNEHGVETAVESFHARLPLGIMGCLLVPGRAAAWSHTKHKHIRLSALAGIVLRKENLLDLKHLKCHQPSNYELHQGPWEPISGGSLVVTDLFYEVFRGFGEIGWDLAKMARSTRKISPEADDTAKASTENQVSLGTSSESSKGPGYLSAKGSARILKATARAPMAFSLALAQGSHNAPKLWGDKSVRPQDEITGVVSGIVAGVKELTLGTYDGIAGLVMQPISGAREEGAVGFVKGCGKGVIGAPVKFFAAMSGPVGYPLKGIDMEIRKAWTRRKIDAPLQSRLEQGESDYAGASEEEKREIIAGWQRLMEETEKDSKGLWRSKWKARRTEPEEDEDTGDT